MVAFQLAILELDQTFVQYVKCTAFKVSPTLLGSSNACTARTYARPVSSYPNMHDDFFGCCQIHALYYSWLSLEQRDLAPELLTYIDFCAQPSALYRLPWIL